VLAFGTTDVVFDQKFQIFEEIKVSRLGDRGRWLGASVLCLTILTILAISSSGMYSTTGCHSHICLIITKQPVHCTKWKHHVTLVVRTHKRWWRVGIAISITGTGTRAIDTAIAHITACEAGHPL